MKDEEEMSALHHSVRAEASKLSLKCLELLIARGCNLDHQDRRGRTALSVAAEKGKKDAVKLLLQNGANFEIADKSGKTVLHSVDKQTKSFLKNQIVTSFLLFSPVFNVTKIFHHSRKR